MQRFAGQHLAKLCTAAWYRQVLPFCCNATASAKVGDALSQALQPPRSLTLLYLVLKLAQLAQCSLLLERHTLILPNGWCSDVISFFLCWIYGVR